jgi:hypothetical protein
VANTSAWVSPTVFTAGSGGAPWAVEIAPVGTKLAPVVCDGKGLSIPRTMASPGSFTPRGHVRDRECSFFQTWEQHDANPDSAIIYVLQEKRQSIVTADYETMTALTP